MDGARSGARTALLRDLALLWLAAWTARALFLWALPSAALSTDLGFWQRVVDELAAGRNPYVTTTHLNWPPVWMGVLFVLGKISAAADVPLVHAIRGFLMGVESGVIAATYLFARRLATARQARTAVLAGLSLNPICILQVSMHCNFDVLVGLWVLLAVASLVTYLDTGRPGRWLAASLFVGLGTLTKTVPVVLCTLLATGAARFGARRLAAGAALALGPAALAVGILLAIAPQDVLTKVIAYRSIPGYFGITGLLGAWGGKEAMRLWVSAFPWLYAAALVATAIRFARPPRPSADTVILAAALLLMAIPTFGSGYNPQYAYWYLPLLVARFPAADRRWRAILWAGYALAVPTYIFEYAWYPTHGMALVHWLGTQQAWATAQHWSLPASQTFVRLPLFLWCAAAVLAAALRVSEERPRYSLK